MIGRRHVGGLLVGGALWPLAARTQQPEPAVPEFGMLYPGPPTAAAERARILWQGLNERGFVEGKNLVLLSRSTDNDADRMAAFASELVTRNVRVIFAVGPPAVRAARAATMSIPIIGLDLETDPIATGMIATLARPGGNVTGLFFDFPDFSGKWLQLLAEAVPDLTRVAVLWDSTSGSVQVEAAKTAAARQHLEIQVLPVRTPDDLAPAFADAAHDHAQGIVVLSSPLFSAIIGAKRPADL